MGKYEANVDYGSKISRYWKTIVAVIGALIILGNELVPLFVEGYGDGTWTTQDTFTVGFAFITAIGVWWKANAHVFNGVAVVQYDEDGLEKGMNLILDGPPENLIGMDHVTFKVDAAR